MLYLHEALHSFNLQLGLAAVVAARRAVATRRPIAVATRAVAKIATRAVAITATAAEVATRRTVATKGLKRKRKK